MSDSEQGPTVGAPKRSGWRSFGPAVGQFAVVVLVLWIAYPYFDLEKTQAALEGLSPLTALVFVTLALLVRVVDGWRWHDIANNFLGLRTPSIWFLTRVTLLAQFTNVWVPSFLGGEGVRVWKLARATEMSRKVPLSVMVDRVVGLSSLITLSFPLLLVFPAFIPDIREAVGTPALLWGGVAFVGLLTLALVWKQRMFLGLARRVVGFFVEHNFFVRPMLISMLGLGLVGSAYWFLLSAMQDVSVLQVAALTLIPRFGRVFPVSALGVGVVEGGTFVVGGYLGIDPQPLVILVSMHVTTKYVAAFLGAILEVAYEGRGALFDLLSRRPPESTGIVEEIPTRFEGQAEK